MGKWKSTMESLVMRPENWRHRRVFITGHTGFKGSWLTLCLKSLGADVVGYSDQIAEGPNLFEQAAVAEEVQTFFGDVRDLDCLKSTMKQAAPDLVIHLAAQSLVRKSYQQPIETWETNVMGTVNVLEAIRKCPSVKAALIITTDKCYENREWNWGYRENDSLGGSDPYSASKAGAELVTKSYRASFFDHQGPLIATARAGNVIGGGDWSEDRLIPDAARSVINRSPLMIRNPGSTRPWQHVLECLRGYLLLAERLVNGEKELATAFNFGPGPQDNVAVGQLLSHLKTYWTDLTWTVEANRETLTRHESKFLYLDSSLARQQLGWTPYWSLETGLAKTAEWYKIVQQNIQEGPNITRQQIKEYFSQ